MEKRNTFKGSIGFVLAAAGSAVGLGNIWRFPYLAARDGGGLFIVVYIILALTFGFTLLMTEVAIGRKTRQSPLTAYSALRKKWKWLGVLACIIPMMIFPYYIAIGGWVIKYLVAFITSSPEVAAADGYFGGFITDVTQPLVMMLIFGIAVAIIVYMGVNKGIEASSKIIMPLLILIVIGISIFSLTLSYTDADGTVRTGLQGLKVMFIPNLEGMTVKGFLRVFMDAMGQLFYSLSVAMGIMIAYGSYVPKEANMSKSVNQIEIFDTAIALLAGVMIIPAVFAFMGTEGMSASGPSLMFVTLPKVLAAMGPVGRLVGILFFGMVLFAALTSAISILEAIVASFMDQFKVSRPKAVIIESVIGLVVGAIVCFGYNLLYFEFTLPTGAVAQVLDILDYLSNSILMPIVAISTCILIGWILGPKTVIDEVTRNGEKMNRKGLYIVMVKYLAPVLLTVLFLTALGLF
ncbi:MAG: sodium-dependent transporter [Lachnospiraceae bacterium]|nr:sodium-dependent transporter [Lachnospiraceae bacterium]